MVRLNEWLSEAWDYIMKDFGMWLALAAVALLLGQASCLIVFPPLYAGLYIAASARLRGESPRMEMLWQGFQLFAQSWGLMLLSGVLGALLFFCCFIPGFYVSILWSLAWVILVEERQGGWAAMQRSGEIVKQDFWAWTGLWAVMLLVIMLAGSIPVIGWLAYPFQALVMAIAYRDVVYGRPREVASPGGGFAPPAGYGPTPAPAVDPTIPPPVPPPPPPPPPSSGVS